MPRHPAITATVILALLADGTLLLLSALVSAIIGAVATQRRGGPIVIGLSCQPHLTGSADGR